MDFGFLWILGNGIFVDLGGGIFVDMIALRHIPSFTHDVEIFSPYATYYCIFDLL